MKPSDAAQLLLLAAIWGASFLFIRTSSAEFGPMALAGVRVGIASLCLLPVLLWARQGHFLVRHAGALLLVGLASSALPFVLFNVAALSLPAGVMSVFNATTPLFTAILAWAWLKVGLTRAQVLGLLVGLGGVLGLVWSRSSVQMALPTQTLSGAEPAISALWHHAFWHHPLLASLACVGATVCYGIAANFTRRYLTEMPPLVVATGSQIGAALWLIVPTLAAWPAASPSAQAWGSAALLAVLCSSVAYVMFFRLLVRIGATNTVSVTFLIPLFAVLWGWLFLNEPVSTDMLLGSAVILLGTALATSVIRLPQWRPPAP